MNKRGAKILIGCIICTSIVFLLFLIVFKFAQLSCELVSLDPVRLGSAQLAAFSRDSPKPIRSHDETILMRISAYLEYNIQPEVGETGKTPNGVLWPSLVESSDWLARSNLTQGAHPPGSPSDNPSMKNSTGRLVPSGQQQSIAPQSVGATNQQQQQQQQQPHANRSSPEFQHANGPAPSRPELAAGQIQSPPALISGAGLHQAQLHTPQQPLKTERRFLPLELKSIETRNMLEGAKHKYILNFNCSKINMVLVHQNNRVYVESMSLELRPKSRQETTCEIQLPPSGAFTVADSSGINQQQSFQQQQQPDQSINGTAIHSMGQTNQIQSNLAPGTANSMTNTPTSTTTNKLQSISNSAKSYPQLARYYCNRPLRYSCYHYNSKNGLSQSNGILLAELHINGIEFETSTSWQGKHKKVKSEFKGKRSECNMA